MYLEFNAYSLSFKIIHNKLQEKILAIGVKTMLAMFFDILLM